MCAYCGAPLVPIPVLENGKMNFGRFDWFVLDKLDDRALIITEKVIEKKSYHNKECDITWENSDIRKYLNNEFFDSFIENERKRIIEVINQTNDNPWYGTSGGNATTDKIFLLSVEEVLKYFGDSGQIKTRYMYPNCEWCNDEYLPWIDDKYNLNRCAVDDSGIVRSYRLRSPGAVQFATATVVGYDGDGYDMGIIGMSGPCGDLVDGHFIFDIPKTGQLSVNPVYHNPNGVRPAMWVKV